MANSDEFWSCCETAQNEIRCICSRDWLYSVSVKMLPRNFSLLCAVGTSSSNWNILWTSFCFVIISTSMDRLQAELHVNAVWLTPSFQVLPTSQTIYSVVKHRAAKGKVAAWRHVHCFDFCFQMCPKTPLWALSCLSETHFWQELFGHTDREDKTELPRLHCHQCCTRGDGNMFRWVQWSGNCTWMPSTERLRKEHFDGSVWVESTVKALGLLEYKIGQRFLVNKMHKSAVPLKSVNW